MHRHLKLSLSLDSNNNSSDNANGNNNNNAPHIVAHVDNNVRPKSHTIQRSLPFVFAKLFVDPFTKFPLRVRMRVSCVDYSLGLAGLCGGRFANRGLERSPLCQGIIVHQTGSLCRPALLCVFT